MNRINVVGQIWMPNTTAATVYRPTTRELEDISDDVGVTREDIQDWLDTHAGDFRAIDDFEADIDGEHFPFETEEGEMAFMDCMFSEV